MNKLYKNIARVLAITLFLCISLKSYSQSITVSFTLSDYHGSNISCHGASDGSIQSNVSGGTAPYTYSWNTGEAVQNLTNIIAGAYILTVTDSNNVSVVDTVLLTEPGLIGISFTSQTYNGFNVSAYGSTNANINTTITGGTTPYTNYSWSNGSQDASPQNLAAGIYALIVTDENGCTASATDTLSQPDILRVDTLTSPLHNGYNVSCNSGSNGCIRLCVSGGAPFTSSSKYHYTWSNGQGDSWNTRNVQNALAGNYTVQITDANGNEIDTTIKLTQPDSIKAKISSPSVFYSSGGIAYKISCYGCSDGSINIDSMKGGISPYTFSWYKNIAISQDSLIGSGNSITNLQSGLYKLKVSDANGCDFTPITEYEELIGSIDDDSGTVITSQISGDPRIFLSQPDQTYPLQIVSNIIGNYHGYNVRCYGDSTASIHNVITGGVYPYTYLWNTGDTTKNISNLGAGTYILTVTDGIGNTATSDTVFILEPNHLTHSLSASDYNGFSISQHGGNDGSISSSINGGAPAYTYLWSNGATGQNLSALVAGTYSVTVADMNGCALSDSITLTEPAIFKIDSLNSPTVNGYNVPCNPGNPAWNPLISGGAPGTPGSGAGTINLTVSGGVPPYDYTWANTDFGRMWSQQNIDNGPAGHYTLKVIDANGLELDTSIALTTPDPFYFTEEGSIVMYGSYGASCYNCHDGEMIAQVTGGFPPYSYQWYNYDSGVMIGTDEILTNLGPGRYNTFVTDQNGCEIYYSPIILSAPPQGSPITAYLNGVSPSADGSGNESCVGGNDAGIHAVVFGGTYPITYKWSNGATTKDITNLRAGDYTLTVTDAAGDTTVSTITVGEPAPIGNLSIYIQQYEGGFNVSSYGATDGQVSISNTGGVAPYTYSWKNNLVDTSISGYAGYIYAIAAGTYSLQVSDLNGCTLSSSFTLTEPQLLKIDSIGSPLYNGYNVSCTGGYSGTASVNVSGGYAPYSYTWTNGLGGYWNTQTIQNAPAGQYSVQIFDANGTEIDTSITLTEPPNPLAVSVYAIQYGNGYNVSCYYCMDGSLSAAASGGVGSYSYQWFNSNDSLLSSLDSISNYEGGIYYAAITDANGCSISSGAITITQPDYTPLSLTLTGTDALIHGTSTGNITTFVTGGTPPYVSYAWNTGATTQNVSSIPAGSYSLTVYDSHNDSISNGIDILEPTAMQVDNISADIKNGGYSLSYHGSNDGNAYVAVSGGVPFVDVYGQPYYNYSWSNGAGGFWNTQNIQNANAGHYIVRVMDANGAEIDTGITLTQPDAITIALNVTHYPNGFNVSSIGAYDGGIGTNVTGGVGPYTFYWVNMTYGYGITTADSASSLNYGQYQVTVTDANGGTATADRWLFQPQDYNGGWGMSGSTNTDPSFNFIGTSDSVDFVMRADNTEALRLMANGQIKINGYTNSENQVMYVDSAGNVQLANGGNTATISDDLKHLRVDSTALLNDSIFNTAIGLAQAYSGACTDTKATTWYSGITGADMTRCDGNIGLGTNNPSANIHIKKDNPKIRLEDNVSLGGNDQTCNFEMIAANGVGRLASNGGVAVFLNATKDGPAGDVFFSIAKNENYFSSTYLSNELFRVNSDGIAFARGMKIQASPESFSYPDYVFNSKYELMPLGKLEKYINEHKHLPDIPSVDEIEKGKGFEIGDMQRRLLKKVEELTLYTIELQKQSVEMQKQIDDIKEENKSLRKLSNKK